MDEIEKIKHLLQHWMDHNEAHVKTYSEWAEKAASMGEKELSELLERIADESRKFEQLFKKAMNAIQQKQ